MTTPDVITLCETYALLSERAQEAVGLLSYHDVSHKFAGRYKRLPPVDQYHVTDWLELATAYGLDDAETLLAIAQEHNEKHPDAGRVAWYTLHLESLDTQRRSAS